MKKILALSLVLSSSLSVAEQTASSQDQARQNALLLGQALQAELMQAMKAGGPSAAIAVCNTRAMPLSAEISQQTQWHIARTSLKVRNSNNAADSWERQQLESFDKQLADGVPAAQIESYAIIEENGKQYERFMKAIPTQEGCLQCHGEVISAELSEQLYRLYPEDKARGFSLGQLRGAFTLKRELDTQSL